MQRFKDELVKEVNKKGLPICDILIYFVAALLAIWLEPLWGTFLVICLAGIFWFSWWITRNESSPTRL